MRTAFSRAALRRTLPAALVVGGTLAVVNGATSALRLAITFLVPFCNATYGFIAGSRRMLREMAEHQTGARQSPDPAS